MAALHTQILKESELKPFYDLYPQKFNNKTNGITFRRWLEACNPSLAGLIDQCIGGGWRKDPRQLEDLLNFGDDPAVLERLLAIKQDNKNQLCRLLWAEQSIALDPQSIFDIQIKRLHEYKRQQMNALYIIRKYLDIKAGRLPQRPVSVLFGAKAAPAYGHGQAHHPSDPLPPAAHRGGPPGPSLAPGGHGGELQRDLGGAADPRL